MKRYFLFLMSFSFFVIMTGSLGGIGLVASGCGGSGSSSSSEEGGAGATGGIGSALSVADTVSVIDAQDSTSSSMSALMKAASTDLSSTSDYFTDETNIYVEERSAEALDMINEILCMIGQSGYHDLVNQGDYRAQVDISLCDSNNDSVEGQGEDDSNGSSASNLPEYEFWTVNSYRADDSSDHIVAAWIHMPGDEFEPAQVIEARVNITEEPSDNNPYGIMDMYFSATLEESPDSETFKGFLKISEEADGSITLTFYDHGEMEMDGQFFSFGERVAVTRDGSTISGSAEVVGFEGDGATTYNFAANDDLFYRQVGSDSPVCLSRSNYDETVHRYNLYYNEDATNPGSRVELNSGFPVVFIDDSEERHHGHVGYWGAWFPEGEEGSTPSHGDTVYKQTFQADGPPTETPYTLFKSGGKLKKRTLETITLGDIVGLPLSWHDWNESTQTSTHYRVEWDGTTFYKTGTMNEENWIWEEITPVAVSFGSDDWSFNGYSEALNGNVMIELRNNSTSSLITLANSTPVIFHREEVVMPGDTIPSSFICFENCPDPSKIDTESPYFTNSTWEAGDNSYSNKAQTVAPTAMVSGTHYVPYTFDATNMVLKYNGTAVAMSDNTESEFGVWTNFLIEPTAANLSSLRCSWNTSTTCPWQAQTDALVYYTYETGSQEWNHLVLLQDPTTLAFLEFDPPINFEYVHVENGNIYSLNYGGQGDLWGIPGKCVDMDTGLDTECGNWEEGSPVRWVSEFNIPDGAEVTDYEGTTFYVKGIDREQRMIAGSEADCTAAGLSLVERDLPSESEWQAPDIGDEPALEEAAPAVIGGVLQ